LDRLLPAFVSTYSTVSPKKQQILLYPAFEKNPVLTTFAQLLPRVDAIAELQTQSPANRDDCLPESTDR